MPKNKGAGGKKRRKSKGGLVKTKELVYKSDGQEYGQITRSLGNGYMEVMCFDTNCNVIRRAHICGKMRKRVWMAVGDIVLVNIRGYQDSTCDIVLKYTSDEARILRMRRQLPDNIDVNKTDTIADDIALEFNDNDNGEENTDDETEQENEPAWTSNNRNYGLPPSDSESDSEIENL